jgi:hypothetical protein
MKNHLDARIRQLHIAQYGSTDEVKGYLRTLESLVPVRDDKRGENHHVLARSVWPEFADLRVHPWNRLRCSHAIHTALTTIQAWFERKLRSAALRMKGQTLEAHLEACSRGGKIGGRTAGKLRGMIATATPGYMSMMGKRTHELHPNQASENGKRCAELHPNLAKERGKKGGMVNVESGHISRLGKSGVGGKIGGKIAGRKAVESGQLARIRTRDSCSRGGKTQGERMVKSGHLARIRSRMMLGTAYKESRVWSMAKALHTRWHVNRGVVNPQCPLCSSILDSPP